MEIIDAKRVAERLLASITPSLPTAFEGVDFIPPAGMYQSCFLKINAPTDPVWPAGYHRENTVFNVFVIDVKGQGTTDVLLRAGLIRDTFYKGRTFIEGTTRIHILETAQISGPAVLNDRLVVPILIPLTVEVYRN